MKAVDSNTVLWGQTLMYTAYCLAIISVVAWFARKITRPKGSHDVTPKLFYGWVGFLALLGVSLHLLTYNTIPLGQGRPARQQGLRRDLPDHRR